MKDPRRGLRIAFVVVLVLVVLIGGLVAIKHLFVQFLATTTGDTVLFVEECPVPEELKIDSPTQDEFKVMVEWCCDNYDDSRAVCHLLRAAEK